MKALLFALGAIIGGRLTSGERRVTRNIQAERGLALDRARTFEVDDAVSRIRRTLRTYPGRCVQ